jgi:hypothetical protein
LNLPGGNLISFQVPGKCGQQTNQQKLNVNTETTHKKLLGIIWYVESTQFAIKDN